MVNEHPSPTLGGREVLWISLAMLGIVVVAGAVMLYVAFPHRGQPVPRAPWVGDALERGVRKLPTLGNR
jgi:hypothetical protein